MEKLKWKYDKKYKQWWITESSAYADDGFTIKKNEAEYMLFSERYNKNFYFKKFSSAKQVAQLLTNG